MTTVRTEPQAPHWLVQLLRPAPAPVPWKRVARATAGIAGPVAAGMAAGRLDLGVLASIGGLCATLADTDGPYWYRTRRIGYVITAGALGFFTGTATGSTAWLSGAMVVVVAVLSALISVNGDIASRAGLQLLVFTVVGSAQTAPPLTALGCFAAGAAFAMLLAIGAWPVRATAPERTAIANVYDALADMLRGTGTPAARPARLRATAAINVAYDRLLDARSRLSGRNQAYRNLLTLLTATTPLIEASVATVAARDRPDDTLINHIDALADAIRKDEPFPPLPDASSALHDALRRVHDRDDDARGTTPSKEKATVGERLRRLADTTITGPQTWLFVLRLTVCVTLAELVGIVLSLDHANWVALTVAIVLKPDFGSVFGRAVLRAGGTAVGVVLGAGLLALAPHGWLLVIVMAVVAAMLPVGQVRNYGMFSTFVTPLVIVQLDLANSGSFTLVVARLVDTAVGCLIVVVFGYLLWPGSRKADVGDQLARTCDTVGTYLDRALSGAPQGRSALRRKAYRELSDLRTVFQRAIVEPSKAGRTASAWWPLIVFLERMTDAVTEVAVQIERGAPPPDQADVTLLSAGVTEAAAALREGRKPAKLELPATDQLEAVTRELDGVLRTLRGPAATRPRRTWRVGGLLPRRRGAQPGSAG
ncbi:FUSC family protein [Labedaea rhizosphaerae]|uniref:Putative membrane protein YccC n=1 Tax=Labedaea rhizosphaerae TaxID=598644 RepID=A0A4R6SNW5_LABRH|nr:FUSC family protein [Labedaea rhizosphaerae]TDQ04883.1 putative membrane protein YccC [Labedaea rhizosphaerae]